MKWITSLIVAIAGKGKKPPAKPLTTAQAVMVSQRSRPATITYPSADEGYTRALVADLLASQSETIDRLRVAVTPKRYKEEYEPVLIALANWILNLPRSETEEFSEPGGLLRFSIECGFHCQRMAEQSLFASNEAIEHRQSLEKAWCYATFLAGMFSEVSRLTAFVVTTPSGHTWECFNHSLDSFLDNHRASTFYLSFKAEPQQPEVNPALAQRIIPPIFLQQLSDINPNIVRVMFLAMEGRADTTKPRLYEIVARVKEGVLDRARRNQPKQYGRLRQGTHIEPYLVDGLRACLKTWTINTYPAWIGDDGLYIARAGIGDVINFLVSRDIRAIPASEDTVAELLISAGLVSRGPEASIYTTIYPGENPERAIRIAHYKHLFDMADQPTSLGCLTAAPRRKPKQPTDNCNLFDAGTASVSQDTQDSEAVNLLDDSSTSNRGEEGSQGNTTESQNGLAATANQPKQEGSRNRTKQPRKKPAQEQVVAEEAQEIVVAGLPVDEATVKAQPLNIQAAPVTEVIQQNVATPVRQNAANEEGASLLNAAPVKHAISDLADQLLRQTHDPGVSEFLKAIIHDHNHQKVYGTQWTPVGFAIHKDLIPRYGMDEVVLFTKLHAVGWLSRNPDKPNQKFLEVDFPDGKARAIVLKNLIAQDLGVNKT